MRDVGFVMSLLSTERRHPSACLVAEKAQLQSVMHNKTPTDANIFYITYIVAFTCFCTRAVICLHFGTCLCTHSVK